MSMTNEEIFNTMQDLVELVMAMEEEFDIGEVQEEELGTLKTVGDAVRYVAGKQN